MLSCFYSNFGLCFQMTAFLVGIANLYKYTQMEWLKSTNFYKAAVVKAEKGKEKAEKDKKASESQYAVLESEKAALTKAVEEARAVRDQAIAMANTLKSKQERLV